MAKASVCHSEDACTIIFRGDKRRPEPGTGIIRFPGGFVEVSRCSDGSYWSHVYRDTGAKIVGSRVNYDPSVPGVPDIPHEAAIMGLSIRVDGPFFEPGE